MQTSLGLAAGGEIAYDPWLYAYAWIRRTGAAHDQGACSTAAAALAVGENVPAATTAAMARPLMPSSVYMMMGNLGWHMTAREHGAWLRLGARPLAQNGS
jgi:hypothetical protein